MRVFAIAIATNNVNAPPPRKTTIKGCVSSRTGTRKQAIAVINIGTDQITIWRPPYAFISYHNSGDLNAFGNLNPYQ